MAARKDREDEHSPECRESLRQLAIVADDLTGACDAAIAFTRVSEGVHVQLAPETPPGEGIWAVSTNTRDTAPAEARRRIIGWGNALASRLNVIKKIDSVFRGNTFVEIATAAQSFSADLVLIAPAYPALGRRLRGGELHVEDAHASHVIPVTQKLADAGCPVEPIPVATRPNGFVQRLRQILLAGKRIVLCDAWTQDDLDGIAVGVRSLGIRTLWVGSGGLAHALAATYRPVQHVAEAEHRPGRPVFLIGSDHPITQAQVRHLQEVAGWTPDRRQNASISIAQSGLVLTITRGQTQEADIRATLSEIPPETIGCLFITGGDTAWLVCRALGIGSLRLQREVAPGVPMAVAEGGLFHGVPVILKSGGFGEKDLLCRIHDMFCRKEEALA